MPSICEKHSNPPEVITSQDEIIKSTQHFAQSQVDVLAALMTSQRIFFALSGNSKWAHRDDNCLLHRKSQTLMYFIVICFEGKWWVCGMHLQSLLYSASHDSQVLWSRVSRKSATQSPFWAQFVVHTDMEGEEESIYRTGVRTMNLELKVKVIWAVSDMEIIHLHLHQVHPLEWANASGAFSQSALEIIKRWRCDCFIIHIL